MNFAIPHIFTEPIHVMEIKRQPKKAFRVIKLVKSKSYQDFLVKKVQEILKQK